MFEFKNAMRLYLIVGVIVLVVIDTCSLSQNGVHLYSAAVFEVDRPAAVLQ